MRDIYHELQEKAESAAHQEVCGYLLSSGSYHMDYFPVVNTTRQDPATHFEISPDEQLAFAKTGRTLALFHSHVNDDPTPSGADINVAEKLNLPLLIYSVKTKTFSGYKPFKSIPPLEARPFIVGMYDCFALMEDYYRVTVGHQFPYIRRSVDEIQNGYPDVDAYMQRQGFRAVPYDDMKESDCLMISHTDAGLINHCGICRGEGRFLHQLLNRPSTHSETGVWKSRIKTIYRLNA